ncbi:nucleotide kinase domain-containing protein, partial [Frankia torreyi]
ATGIEEEIIRYMVDSQHEHFARLGLSFRGLAGTRPLKLIDCQNLFCEVDKYARVAHPHVTGISGRSRIKQHFRMNSDSLDAWFPPKWGINGGDAPHRMRSEYPEKKFSDRSKNTLFDVESGELAAW